MIPKKASPIVDENQRKVYVVFTNPISEKGVRKLYTLDITFSFDGLVFGVCNLRDRKGLASPIGGIMVLLSKNKKKPLFVGNFNGTQTGAQTRIEHLFPSGKKKILKYIKEQSITAHNKKARDLAAFLLSEYK